MIEIMLREGVLNDDILTLPEKGKVFKGQYVALVKYYKFATAWSNSEHVKRFRSRERLEQYLDKNYPESVDDLDFTGSCIE
jgi:hypothetical protein